MPDNHTQSSLPQEYTHLSQSSASSTEDIQKLQSVATYTKIIYGLYILAAFFGVTLLVGVIIAYAKREEANDTIYRGHIEALIKWFWWAICGYVVGVVTSFFLIGFVICFVVEIWLLYKTVTGLIRCIDGKPIT